MQTEKSYIAYTGYAPLHPLQNSASRKLCDIPPGTIVERITAPETKDGWSEVLYKTNTKTWRGFTYAEYVEPFVEPKRSNIISIRNATPTDSDFAQNLILWGRTQYNLCGEFSVLYCAGWTAKNKADFFIEDWIEAWKISPIADFTRLFARAFPSLRSATTGIYDLEIMLSWFEGMQVQNLRELYDYKGRTIFTPARTQKILQENHILIGCKIESRFGRLSNAGIGHWVVITEMEPEGRGGLVKIFNPATNSEETYTWEQVAASCRVPYGWAVKKV